MLLLFAGVRPVPSQSHKYKRSLSALSSDSNNRGWFILQSSEKSHQPWTSRTIGLDKRSNKEVDNNNYGDNGWKMTGSWHDVNNNLNRDPAHFFLPEVPIGDEAGVPLCTLSPNNWEEAGGRGWSATPEGPGRGPGGVSLCGDVRGVLRGVLGCDVCPPANRTSRLLRILK